MRGHLPYPLGPAYEVLPFEVSGGAAPTRPPHVSEGRTCLTLVFSVNNWFGLLRGKEITVNDMREEALGHPHGKALSPKHMVFPTRCNLIRKDVPEGSR